MWRAGVEGKLWWTLASPTSPGRPTLARRLRQPRLAVRPFGARLYGIDSAMDDHDLPWLTVGDVQ